MGYTVQVKDRVLFMQALVEALAGNALLSLEGDLAGCADAIAAVPGVSDQETACLLRNTLAPPHDFAILPLEQETQEWIVRHILPRVGLRRRVWHVCIEKEGTLHFASFDNFESPSLDDSVPEEFLTALVQRGVLKSYQRFKEEVMDGGES